LFYFEQDRERIDRPQGG